MCKIHENKDRGNPKTETSHYPQRMHMFYVCFAGVVNFLSLFCHELQALLKTTYNLMRKGRVFHWGTEHTGSF